MENREFGCDTKGKNLEREGKLLTVIIKFAPNTNRVIVIECTLVVLVFKVCSNNVNNFKKRIQQAVLRVLKKRNAGYDSCLWDSCAWLDANDYTMIMK